MCVCRVQCPTVWHEYGGCCDFALYRCFGNSGGAGGWLGRLLSWVANSGVEEIDFFQIILRLPRPCLGG